MNSNKKYNEAAIKKFRKELMAMFDDIKDIDIKVLNKSVNIGLDDVKRNTPVLSGDLRIGWRASRIYKSNKGISKTLYNIMDYAEYVNYGHRIVNKAKETLGWVKGKFILEKAVGFIDKQMVKEFKSEVERINKKHDK